MTPTRLLLSLTLLLTACETPAPPAAPTAPAAPAPTASTEAGPTPGELTSPKVWWPERLDLSQLRQNARAATGPGSDADYAAAFATVDLDVLKGELEAVMKTSQDWWPADYGNYGPFFIRMSWHSAGTYRVSDGRGGAAGGQLRFEPLNSWPDNTNLDKARRLLWPLKQKYGERISWADLMVLAGTVAMESMGFQTVGYAGGRADDWEPELVYWGPEATMLEDKRYSGDRKLAKPLAAVQMGLIYVNPEGPNGNPDPLLAAKDIRETFGRMAMNDEETVALIAGGHSFGKAHGAHKPADCVSVEPAAGGVEQQGMGWNNKCGTGKGADAVTSGLEGAWTSSPAAFTTQYLDNLFQFEWVQTKSPGGATQWIPKDGAAAALVPDAHDPTKRHAPIMFTTDLALKFDPIYKEISQRFQKNPKDFEVAFARAWFKLTHRDMGPRARYVGAKVPAEAMSWQDPVPVVDHELVNAKDIAALKQAVLASGLTVPELVRTAWASAASYRDTDMRGGANGARIRLAPQKDWAANDAAELTKVLGTLETIQADFNAKGGKKRVSLADLIVLAGTAAVEKAAADGGNPITVAFSPGRTDATQEQTDVDSFAVLEPHADGFRNYLDTASDAYDRSPSELLVDRADLLGLTVPEMTVLVGGLRGLNANADGTAHGVFTTAPGTLSNDFFLNLLDLSTTWKPGANGLFEGVDRATGTAKWTATEVDLVFGSNAELRAVAEAYAYNDAEPGFVKDFAAAWTKVMNLDRFDLR